MFNYRRMLTFALLSSALLKAESYRQVIQGISKSSAIHAAKLMEEAAREQALSVEGMNFPSLDASFQGAWLKETPVMIMHMPPFPSAPLPVGKTRKFTGSLTLSYPLFSGFAISASIEKSQWQKEQARLKVLDLKRNLILQATSLYAAARSLNATLQAQYAAKKATQKALKKAEGFYNQGLISPADLYNIRAKVYEIDAQIAQTRTEYAQALNRLAYLSARAVHALHGGIVLAPLPSRSKIRALAYRQRADIRALKNALHIDEADIRLAQSRYYPTVALSATLQRHGDTLALNGDGFSNADQSYVGMQMQWNLFRGGQDRHKVEAARYKRLSSASMLVDYERRVATEIDNAYLKLSGLRSKLRSAKMRVKAQKEYYELTEGRFENQLASADELSRSIASLAQARSIHSVIANTIAMQKAKIWLMSGLKVFERKLRQ